MLGREQSRAQAWVGLLAPVGARGSRAAHRPPGQAPVLRAHLSSLSSWRCEWLHYVRRQGWCGGILSARVSADGLHANGGLGRRESQGSVSSAGSLDLVSARRAPPSSTGLPGGAGMGGRAPRSTENISGFIPQCLFSIGHVALTPTGVAGARLCLGLCIRTGLELLRPTAAPVCWGWCPTCLAPRASPR